MRPCTTLAAAAALAVLPAAAGTFTSHQFVNGFTLSGAALDLSTGSAADRRLGYFSDIAYDPVRNEWWGLSDRGPGGGLLNYETRVQRFTLDVAANGAISNFQVAATVKFSDGGQPMNGIAPNPGHLLGRAFDPEGIAIVPSNGHLLVSDEYGPSLAEFDRNGNLLRRFTTPANLLPRNAGTGALNFNGDGGNTAGRRSNRGFEGLAISPDGRYTYAMLQSAMLDEGGGNGVYARIVQFDNETGLAVAQFAYRMDTAGQGRGISSLVALGDNRFLVLERNNRGLGVDSSLGSPNKKVFRISLAGASDVTNVKLNDPAASFVPVTKTATPWLDLAAASTLGHPSLAALGGVSPEKWEGLAIGPRLEDGSYLVVTGTDADYSVTQNATGTQRDVYFKPGATAGSVLRIQCDIGSFANCLSVNADGSTGAAVAADFDFTGYRLLPGVLHAYKASAADLAGYLPSGTRRWNWR